MSSVSKPVSAITWSPDYHKNKNSVLLTIKISLTLTIGISEYKGRRPYPNCHEQRHFDVFLKTHPLTPPPQDVEHGNTKSVLHDTVMKDGNYERTL